MSRKKRYERAFDTDGGGEGGIMVLGEGYSEETGRVEPARIVICRGNVFTGRDVPFADDLPDASEWIGGLYPKDRAKFLKAVAHVLGYKVVRR